MTTIFKFDFIKGSDFEEVCMLYTLYNHSHNLFILIGGNWCMLFEVADWGDSSFKYLSKDVSINQLLPCSML